MDVDRFYSDALDHGFVRLDGCMADDISVARAARVSFAKEAEELGEAEIGLIKFLMRERHGTPFEHNAFRWHIKCPIFVMREWIRHRISSFNEQSGRYSKLTREFYIPEYVRTQVGKPGAYTFEPVDYERAEFSQDRLRYSYGVAWGAYEALLDEGIAKEIARLSLPLATYTQFYWTINARSLMNFLSLRNSPQAQYEIACYAQVIEEMFAQIMPITHEAFEENGRVAP